MLVRLIAAHEDRLTNCNLIHIHLLLNTAARMRHSGRVSAAEREETMQARTTLLSATATALGFALVVGSAWAADLPSRSQSSSGPANSTEPLPSVPRCPPGNSG